MVKLRTRLTDYLSIEHPIISAPMAFAAGGKLAAAVSSAGGLGLIGGGYGDQGWLTEQFEISKSNRIGCGFISWSLEKNISLLEFAISQRPSAIMLSFGDIASFAKKILDSGVKLICQVQTLDDVRASLAHGAQIIVAQGVEGGGHVRSRSLFPFIPEVHDLISKENSKALLVAAGGIADGRGLAAALSLGADGVLIGSRYWSSHEALVHPNFHSEALNADGDQTIQTHVVDIARKKNWPKEFTTRILVNDFVRQWHGKESLLLEDQNKEYVRYEEARLKGDTQIAGTFVGECVGLIPTILSAAEITQNIVDGAVKIINQNQGLLAP